MAEKKVYNTRVQNKRESWAGWAAASGFTPRDGEIIVYKTDNIHKIPKIKIGDGESNVNDLDFIDQDLRDDLDNLITCGTSDPTEDTVGQFYFKYTEN